LIVNFIDFSAPAHLFAFIENGDLARGDGFDWLIVAEINVFSFKAEGAKLIGLTVTELHPDVNRFGGFRADPIDFFYQAGIGIEKILFVAIRDVKDILLDVFLIDEPGIIRTLRP
jgi:hypothetical protein